VSGAATPLPGPLGEQLRSRVGAATAQARRLLGDEGGEGGDGLREVVALIAALRERLGEDSDSEPAELARLRERYERRFDAMARVNAAVARLREQTSPPVMLARAPRELCTHSDFDRAVVSLLADGAIVAEAAYFRGDEAGASQALAALRDDPPRLDRPLIETEVLRRRRATIVLDADVHPRVHAGATRVMGWTSYVAAPLVVRSTVVGVVHADRGPGAPLDVVHRDLLWEFAEGLARAYETAGLRRTLRVERDRMREFLDWFGARSGELGDAAGDLVAPARAQLPALDGSDGLVATGGRDDRIQFAGLLTRRELDVLRLLAEGHSTKAIAAELVLSPGTIKFHVNNILRKLHAANRAQAVSRYFALMNTRAPRP
jgi:LuxR family transcriptional regulator, regulator of acetate metabolism